VISKDVYKADMSAAALRYVAVFIAALVAAVSVEASAAQAPIPITQLDMADPRCTISAAASSEVQDQATAVLEALNNQQEVLNKLKQRMRSRPSTGGISIGGATLPESDDLADLQAQVKIGTLSNLMASKRQRDLRVFKGMIDLVRQTRADFQIPEDQASKDYYLTMVIAEAQKNFTLNDAALRRLLATKGMCSLENALIAEAKRVQDGIRDTPGIDQTLGDFDALRRKHGTLIDPSKFDENEKIIYARSPVVFAAPQNGLRYVQNLALIARLEAVSKLLRDSGRQSLYEAPGDADHVNAVWKAWKAEKRITSEQDQLARLIFLINDRIPADFAEALISMPAGQMVR
jgi:hypothetical protein